MYLRFLERLRTVGHSQVPPFEDSLRIGLTFLKVRMIRFLARKIFGSHYMHRLARYGVR